MPSQLSTGVLSQNSARTAVVRSKTGATRPSAIKPTAAPVTKGTSSIPQAPCSRGTIRARRRCFCGALSLAVLSTIIVWEISAIAANFTSRFANELRSHREQGHR